MTGHWKTAVFVVLPAIAYVIGSIPFGVMIARLHQVDLRKAGSGNVGATNVGRVVGRPWGYLCFVLDVAKGFVPVWVVGMALREDGRPEVVGQCLWLSVGLGAILGHVFSFWLKFKGGKGVATAMGVVVGVYPFLTYAGLAALAIWIAVTLISRYVSLGSVTAAIAFLPLFVVLNWPPWDLWPLGTFAALMVGLILLRHRGNISRLLKGTENRIGRDGSSTSA